MDIDNFCPSPLEIDIDLETMTEIVATELNAITFSDSIQQLISGFTGRTWVFGSGE